MSTPITLVGSATYDSFDPNTTLVASVDYTSPIDGETGIVYSDPAVPPPASSPGSNQTGQDEILQIVILNDTKAAIDALQQFGGGTL